MKADRGDTSSGAEGPKDCQQHQKLGGRHEQSVPHSRLNRASHWLPDLRLPVSGTVRHYVSVVQATQFVVLCDSGRGH